MTNFPTIPASLWTIIGIFLGWLLKAQADLVSWWAKDARQFRRATFYLMTAYKALLDYERATRYFRSRRPSVEEYDIQRSRAIEIFQCGASFDEAPTDEALDLLSQVSPTLAMDLAASIGRIRTAFQADLSGLVLRDQDAYASLLKAEDQLVELALHDIKRATFRTARRGAQYWKVYLWVRNREGSGRREFEAGMEQQADLRARVWSAGQKKPSE